jgi:hypothetical protein
MALFEPSDAVAAIERSLRQLLDFVFRREARLGENWYESSGLVNNDMRRSAQFATSEHNSVAAREGRATTDAPLDFTRLDDLVKLAKKEWALVEPALGAQSDMLPVLDRACAYRHDSAHSRRLPAPARDLLSGIAFEIQNRVNMFMSAQDEAGSYFPRVTEVSDSTGRQLGAHALAETHASIYLQGAPQVHLGETVEVEVTAVDSQNRQLEWMCTDVSTTEFGFAQAIEPPLTHVTALKTTDSGSTYREQWTFNRMGSPFELWVLVRAVGAAHHQHGADGADVLVRLPFRILPGR